MTNGRLHAALREIAAAAPPGRDDWWIIGSAALVLAGIDDIEPADVDLLGSTPTIRGFLDGWGVAPPEPKPGQRFRSEHYRRIDRPGALAIETMGDLEVLSDGGWQKVRPETRIAVAIGGATVFIPALPEQLAILRLFGREKDLAKARLVEDRR